MPAIGMRSVLLAALLLGSAVLQASAAGGWFPDMFANPLKGVQRRLQQQQYQRLAHLDTTPTDSETAELVGRRLQQLEQHQQSAEQQGSYGYGGYGGYGYYGYYGAETTAGAASTNSNGRSLLSVPSLAPTLVYGGPERVQHRVLAGLAHHDDIEVPADAAAGITSSVFETIGEQRAARKLLVANSDIVAPVAAVPAQVVALQPVDALLSSSSRSLLEDASTGAYGGYGYGGYAYGGYGYGAYNGVSAPAAPASKSSTGRALLEVAETDDVQLYNLWLQQYNSKHHGK